MKFYSEEFVKLRKQERFSIKEICSRAKIARTTLWEWENDKRIPSESNIRMLARIINKSISDISDLESEEHYSKGDFSEVVDSWLSLSDINNSVRHNKCIKVITEINSLDKELSQATIVIKALLSSLDAIFYIKDSQSKYITASNSFLENIGLRPEYMVKGKTDFDFFSKQNAESNNKQDEEVITTGKPIIHAEDFVPGSRNKKWGLASKRPIIDPSGKIAGIVGIFVDITERKKSEKTLSLLKKCLDSMKDGVILQDSSSQNIYYHNKAIETIYGYTKEEVLEETDNPLQFWVNNCVHPDFKEKELKYIREKKWPESRSCKIIKKNGETHWIHTNITKEFINTEECHLSITSDITEKIISRDKIAKLLSIMDKIDECIWLGKFDKTNKINLSYVSKAFEKMSGLSSTALINNPDIWFDCLHPDYKNYLKKERLRQANESLLQYSYEYKIVNRKTGIISHLHESVYIENSVLFGITRDITEQEKLYRQNTQMNNFINSSEEVFWFGEADKNKNLIKMDFVNKSLYNITGIKTDEFMNCHGTANIWHEIIHKEDLKKFKEWNKLGEFEYRVYNKVTNKIVWLLVKNYLEGNIKYGFIFDVSEKKKKEQHRKILEYSINNINDGFWIIKDNATENLADDVEYINDSFMKIFGLKKEEWNPDVWQNTIHPDDKQAILSQIESDSYPKIYKYRIIRSNDKKIRWIEETVYLKDGYNYGIVKDMTSHYEEKIHEEKKTKIEIAKRLKAKNITIKIISQTTGLDISTIEPL